MTPQKEVDYITQIVKLQQEIKILHETLHQQGGKMCLTQHMIKDVEDFYGISTSALDDEVIYKLYIKLREVTG